MDKDAPSPAEQWDMGWGLLLQGRAGDRHMPLGSGVIPHLPFLIAQGDVKPVSWGTVTALSLVNLVLALYGSWAAC